MRRTAFRVRSLVVLAVVFLLPSRGQAQNPPNGQLWGDFIMSWAKTAHLTYELDIEPQLLVYVPPGQPDWASLHLTPSVDYAVKKWLDLTGEFMDAGTQQNNDVNSNEVTERIGVRFHLLSRDVVTLVPDREARELPPRRRLVIRDYARIEQRNIFYSDDTPTSHTWRFRNRIEVQFPFNHESVTADNTRYFLSDWEWFVPINDDPRERYANKQRIRLGFGYRQNFKWRYEGLYMWGRSLDTSTNSFTTADNIIDLRVKRAF